MLRWKSSLKPAAAAPSGDNPGTTNLVVWLGMDEGSGTSVDDSTSNNNDFTLTNGTWVGSGKVGSNAVRLDGSGDYVSSDSALTIGSKICTVSFWMDWTKVGSGEKYLYELGNRWWQTDGSITLKWDQSNTRFLAAMQDSTSGTKYLEVAFPEPSDGQWVYVTVVYNGTANSNAGDIKLYYNGVEQTSSSTPTNTKDQASDFTSSTLYIGANSTGGEEITADLDTFAIFSDELTADEITWLYNSGSGRSYSDVSGGGSTAITLEDSAENEGFTGWSSPYDISVSYPAVSANDILLAIISTERRVDFDGTPPTGWTKVIETDGDNAYNPTQAVYWKRSTGSASASTGNTWSSIMSGAQSYYAWVGAYSGCVTSGSPIDASAGSFQAYNTSWSQSITTQSNNAMILAVAGTDRDSRTFVWSDGTELVDKSYQSTASVSINEKIESTAGATTRSGTISSSQSGTMTAVALKPPAAPVYILQENFEGTGTPSGWSVTSGSADFDATPPSSSPNGGEVLKFTNRYNVAEYSISTSSALYLYFQFYVDSTGFAGTAVVTLQTGSSGRSAALLLNANSTDNLALRSGSNSLDAPVNDYSADTWYHCWIYYNPATGEQNLEFNTTGIRSGSGDGYVSRTINTTTSTINGLRIEGRRNANTYIDRVLISESIIGNNP